MFFYKEKDLQAQGIFKPNNSQILYQGKVFFKNLSLSKRFRLAAMDIYRQEKEAGRLCLIIESDFDLTVWKENINKDSHEFLLQQSSLTPENSQRSESAIKLTPDFLKSCQQQLSKYIGSVSNYVIEDAVKKYPQISPIDFVELLARQIADPKKAKKFKQSLE